ncbi:sensor histidine kinase [Sphingomonas flavalba]|uniref:sensor histidine kinase n=1 Tax=Sphingomonas flavalba TaxID=2559804 RepID=UPI0019CF8442|nr:PAS domain S-box protein [Sphingomonas flavalba]
MRKGGERGDAAGPVADDVALRLAAIVESSDDAIVGKTLDGTITSWNKAAERLFGYREDEILGRSILTLIPPERQHEEHEIVARLRRGERVQHFETERCRKDGSRVPVSLTVSPILRADGTLIGASKIARDISERKAAEAQLRRQSQRLATLNRVAQLILRELDIDRLVHTVTDIATELSGAQFGAFFYNVRDDSGESYLLYTLSGAPREAFANFGMPRNSAVFAPTFAGTEIVRSDDIRRDPRYGRNPPHFGMPKGHLPVVSYLAVPVVSGTGEVIGGLFFGHEQPRMFSEDSEMLIAAIAAQAAVAMDNARLHRDAQREIAERRAAEEAKALMLDELKHRVKNTLATIQAIARQTFRATPPAERDTFLARLQALSDAHDLLNETRWRGATMDDTARRALRPFHDRWSERIAARGPPVDLPSNVALLLAMALHELGTNACKYGALANDSGRVAVEWALDGAGRLSVTWQESGGPSVTPPRAAGFGSRMIERTVAAERGTVAFDYAPGGLSCVITLPYRLHREAAAVTNPR